MAVNSYSQSGAIGASESATATGYALYDCEPSPEQKWLLSAALDQPAVATEAWCRWRQAVALDNVDPASYRLLPLVYRHLSSLDVRESPMDRLKGVYRHTWFKNQTMFRCAEAVIAAFCEAGIPTLLMKGATLSTHYYRDDGIRSMQDIDLMVPRSAFMEAVGVLQKSGWEPFTCAPTAVGWYHRARFKHGCGFRKQGIEIDLHSDLFRFMPQATESLWNDAVPWEWHGNPVYRLSDTDQLFQTCVHGVRWSYGHLSWIPDALAIMGHPESRIDWRRLQQLAELTRTSLYLANALAFLSQEFSAPVPAGFLRTLFELPSSWVEREEYRTLAHVDQGRPLVTLRRVFLLSSRYRAMRKGAGGPIAASPAGWIRFLYTHFRGAGRMGADLSR